VIYSVVAEVGDAMDCVDTSPAVVAVMGCSSDCEGHCKNLDVQLAWEDQLECHCEQEEEI
jgi:hypothetical protein